MKDKEKDNQDNKNLIMLKQNIKFIKFNKSRENSVCKEDLDNRNKLNSKKRKDC